MKPVKFAANLLTKKCEGRRKAIGLENIESWSGRFIETETEFDGEGVAVEAGDILFGKLRPYLAKALLVTEPSDAVGDFHAMRPQRGGHARFLLYQILSKEFIVMVDGSTFGSKMPRASWEFVGKMPLPLPPLPEQIQIASFLDRECGKLDALQAKQERLIELLKEKRQALISHAVTKGLPGVASAKTGLDPTAKLKPSGIEWLGDVPEHWVSKQLKFDLNLVTSGSRGWAQYFADDGELFFRITNIQRNYLEPDLSDMQRVEPPNSAEGERSRIREGDVLISITADLGSVTVAPISLEGAYVSQHVCLTRPNKSLLSKWLGYALKSDSSKAQFEASGYGGTKIQLSLGDIRNFEIALPPLAEQRAIVAHLDEKCGKIDQLKAKAERGIELLKERRSALISAAVTGKIDVRSVAAVSNRQAQPSKTRHGG